MEIILAKTAGFCMGVKRAMQMAMKTAKASSNKVFTCGPLIHNPQAVEFLKENGVESMKNWQALKSGTLIIRAHGMPAAEIEEMKQRGFAIIDATCPHVVTSQKQIRKYSEKGYQIVIIGDQDHPEILSLQSFAAAERCRVISSAEQAQNLELNNKVMVIAQTTFNAEEFKHISDAIAAKNPDTVVCDSICQATSDRQQEIMKLASQVEAVVVVGGKASANTRRLAEIAASLCQKTYHVETAKELESVDFRSLKTCAVTAGASTPDFITDQVIEYLKNHSR